MKRIARLPEPSSLASYRYQCPNSSWDEMRNEPLHGGMAAHRAIRRVTLAQQRCLCAFCERRLQSEVPDLEQDDHVADLRIEHFHPKSDCRANINWHLVWANLWAVCDGGDNWPPGAPPDPKSRVEPRSENLSCDAFKNRQIQKGKLSEQPEGWLLAPDSLPAFPSLFAFSSDGQIRPDDAACNSHQIPGNQYGSTRELVSATILHLNLNCTRLSRLRENVLYEVDDLLEMLRNAELDNGPQKVAEYAEFIFPDDPRHPWPEFFSLFRWLLGGAAEQRLQQIGFVG